MIFTPDLGCHFMNGSERCREPVTQDIIVRCPHNHKMKMRICSGHYRHITAGWALCTQRSCRDRPGSYIGIVRNLQLEQD